MPQFRLLGPVGAQVRGQSVALGGSVPLTILSVLVLNRGAMVSADAIIDATWGERPPAGARSSLHSHLSRLRSALRGKASRYPHLVRSGDTYGLDVDPETVDVHRFQTLWGRCLSTTSNPHETSSTLRRALAQWHGPALAGTRHTPWVRGEVAALESLRLNALETRIDADLALGQHEQVIPELEALTSRHPYREHFHAQLMQALYRGRRQIEALGVYQRLRAVLRDEYGLEPAPELELLQQQILTHDPALA